MAKIEYELTKYRNLDWLEIKAKLPINHVLISEKIISDFLIPDNISPNKYTNNYNVAKLSVGELLIKVNSVLTPFKMEITKSLELYIGENYFERPLGYPTWFISCYPDVADWVDANNELLKTSFPFSEFDTTSLDSQGYLKPKYLRQIVDFYIANERTPLECIIDRTEELLIKSRKDDIFLREEDKRIRLQKIELERAKSERAKLKKAELATVIAQERYELARVQENKRSKIVLFSAVILGIVLVYIVSQYRGDISALLPPDGLGNFLAFCFLFSPALVPLIIVLIYEQLEG